MEQLARSVIKLVLPAMMLGQCLDLMPTTAMDCQILVIDAVLDIF